MDKQQHSETAQALSNDLDILAKKYNLSNYGFVGFVGEPGKGHVPICIHSVLKPQFAGHWHIVVSRVLFLEYTNKLERVGTRIST